MDQTKVLVTVVKNKVAPPMQNSEVRVRLNKGFSQEWSVMQVLVGHGVVKKDTGGVYRIQEDARPDWLESDHIRGEDNFVKAMEDHPDWAQKLERTAKNLVTGEVDTGEIEQELPRLITEDLASHVDEGSTSNKGIVWENP